FHVTGVQTCALPISADRPGIRRRPGPATQPRSNPMKPVHLIPALALALVLAACGGEPDQPAKDAHANDAADHGTEADEHGHEAEDRKSTRLNSSHVK